MTGLWQRGQTKTIEHIEYNNMVRKHLLPPPILDYTRAHADDIFHEIWASNSVAAEKDYAYRCFREWSLVERGKEELKITANEIEGCLQWARIQVISHRAAMDSEVILELKAFRADLFLTALARQHKWEYLLILVQEHAQNYVFDDQFDPDDIVEPYA